MSIQARAEKPVANVRRYADKNKAGNRQGTLERLPKWINLLPMVLQWLWLSVRYRSVTLPSTINPSITAGVLVGEGKLEYFAAMGPISSAYVAPFASHRNANEADVVSAERTMVQAGLSYPIVAKPDIGWCGYGVRKIRHQNDLRAYLHAFPADETIILQSFVPYDGEAAIYYVRSPGEDRGRITGIAKRISPRVVGNGVETIAQLISRDRRLKRTDGRGGADLCIDRDWVPDAGQLVRISAIGSTRAGGTYLDGSTLITAALSTAVDQIARDMSGFYVGRFDVKYKSLSALAKGEGFLILEVNGAGSEAVHAWDPKYGIICAYGIVFEKQRMLFANGELMRRRGHKPIGWWRLLNLFLRQRALIARYPSSN